MLIVLTKIKEFNKTQRNMMNTGRSVRNRPIMIPEWMISDKGHDYIDSRNMST